VVVAARRADRLATLADELPGSVALTADVTDPTALEQLVLSAVRQCGRVDVLVNNAGGGGAAPAMDEPLESFMSTLRLNLVAVFELSRLVARQMAAQGSGSIINIASILGLVSAWPGTSGSYAAAKGAVVQLTRELGCQWATQGIRVNAIAPGFFPSESMDPVASNEGFQRYVRRNCPMGRMGEPHELDGALLFLASDASSYVTGQVLAVDGGWTAH
jgi:NAD(P)-dependent dehydrogenase (short-subunit alcohol dehydrogenase family)